MQKSVAFLYTNNADAEREIKESIHIYSCTKTYKVPRNKLNQRINYLYAENCRKHMKEIEENRKNGKHFILMDSKKKIFLKCQY